MTEDTTPPGTTHINDTEITPEIVAEHGLKPDEYEKVVAHMGRTPNMTELGVFSVMWSEHCSYKSSRKWLKNFPSLGLRLFKGLAKMPASLILATVMRQSLKWKVITTLLLSNLIKGQQRVLVGLCAMFLRWARVR